MTEPTTPRRLATVQEAADYARCHPATIRRRLDDKSLTRYRLGARIVRVDLDELDASMAQSSGAA